MNHSMHLQYLAHLGDPEITTRIERLLLGLVVRMGCEGCIGGG